MFTQIRLDWTLYQLLWLERIGDKLLLLLLLLLMGKRMRMCMWMMMQIEMMMLLLLLRRWRWRRLMRQIGCPIGWSMRGAKAAIFPIGI